MKVTEKMERAFTDAAYSDHEQVTASVAAGLEAVLAMPEMQQLENFARAAAAHATTDGTDEWNHMIDVWNALPQSLVNALLEPR